ncbi:MAG: PaaI family thioesterase, partial [Variibacter sp.]
AAGAAHRLFALTSETELGAPGPLPLPVPPTGFVAAGLSPEAGRPFFRAIRPSQKAPLAYKPLQDATGFDMARAAESAEGQERIRSSFAKQGLMRTLGASLGKVSPGSVEIAMRPAPAISQQHGFVHAGALSAIADTAAGYAALSLMPAGKGVLTTEFKINLVAPAVGERILARGKIVKAGRTLTLAQTEVFAESEGQEKLVALLTATLMTIEGRDGISD